MGLTCHSCESSCVTLNHRVVRMPCYICYTDMVVHLFFLIKKKENYFFFLRVFVSVLYLYAFLYVFAKEKLGKIHDRNVSACVNVIFCFFLCFFFLIKKMKYTK